MCAVATEASAGAGGVLELAWPCTVVQIQDRSQTGGLAFYPISQSLGVDCPCA